VLVAIAEIGDKTQLLSLYLAARYRRPGAIVAGIAVSTLANHALAGALGAWVASLVSPDMLRWILGIAFLGCAVCALFADTLSAPTGLERGRLGVFLITVVAFFIAEMGDKTQLATVALAAKYSTVVVVVLGSTVGMMIANAPVVYAGERLAKRLPVAWARRIASLLFALAGIATLAG
jgi:putative Ca2+/H+ antiporter (TMEM165/GDT1 family)